MMEKKAKLIFAQVDHVSGEILGYAVEKLMEIGANNVQLIPSITKKNRPGNVMMIDIDASREKAISVFLAKELQVSGYHRIHTDHLFHEISFVKKTLHIQCHGNEESFPCELKMIGDPTNPLSVDIEHNFLVHVQRVLKEKWDSSLSLMELKNMIQSRMSESEDIITLEI